MKWELSGLLLMSKTSEARCEKSGDKLEIYLKDSVSGQNYKNIKYVNNMDRIHFILQGAKLTEGGADLKKFYTEKYDLGGKRYTKHSLQPC